MRDTKFAEIIKGVQETFPRADWEKEIKARIKIKKPVYNKPEPENDAIVIDDFIRANAERLCNTHFTEGNSDRSLLCQFVRDKSELKNINVCMKTGKVSKEVNKGNLIGALVAFKIGKEIRIGWSAYNRNHETLPFTRKNAVWVAVIRGLSDGIVVYTTPEVSQKKWVSLSNVQIPTKIAKGLSQFHLRAEKYFVGKANNFEHVFK